MSNKGLIMRKLKYLADWLWWDPWDSLITGERVRICNAMSFPELSISVWLRSSPPVGRALACFVTFWSRAGPENQPRCHSKSYELQGIWSTFQNNSKLEKSLTSSFFFFLEKMKGHRELLRNSLVVVPWLERFKAKNSTLLSMYFN